MSLSRRSFFELSCKTVIIISAGNALQSFSSSGFRLPHQDKIRLRIAVASDGHYGQPDTLYASHHDEMVGWLNMEKKERGVDFTVINGDLIHDDPSFFPEAKQKYDQLKMPYYVSHGNHDKIDPATWEKIWKIPQHFAFEMNDAGFLILNTADDAGKYICPDVAWTRDHLARFQSKKQLLIFMHITPLKWTNGGIDCPEIVELFNKQSNLKAVFHGHDHDQDNVKENHGKHYFFDSHIAGNWGTDYRGYRIIEILNDGEILTYQMNPAAKQKVNDNKIS